jgi:Rrf2 family protein
VISQTGEYALRAAVFLANASDRPRPAWEISAATRIPESYLAKVLGSLARAGLVSSQRGPRGGFVLARDPREITLLDLICAVESWKHVEVCPLSRPEHEARLCPLHRTLCEAESRVEEALRGCTLRELVAPAYGEACSFPECSAPPSRRP